MSAKITFPWWLRLKFWILIKLGKPIPTFKGKGVYRQEGFQYPFFEEDETIPMEPKPILGQYFKDLEFAKKSARKFVGEIAKQKPPLVDQLPVYIYRYKNIMMMVPANEAMAPVQIIGGLSNGTQVVDFVGNTPMAIGFYTINDAR